MNNANEQKKTEEKRSPSEKRKERSKKGKLILDHLITRQKARSGIDLQLNLQLKGREKRKKEQKQKGNF